MIFETHAHYEDEKFDPDRAELLSAMEEKGIGRIIDVGSSMETSSEAMKLAAQYPFVFAAVGVHPDSAASLTLEDMNRLRRMTENEKTVAIGEIGLDYHYENDEAVKNIQKKWFREQLKLAKETDLPVIIHSRDAAKDTMEIMTEAASENIRGVIHCYSYSPDQAREYIRLGYYIGVGGVITFKNGRRLRETVKEIPMERIVMETDCPYMAPEPYRGTRNDSARIPLMIKQVAELKHLSAEEVERKTWENAECLFTKTQTLAADGK